MPSGFFDPTVVAHPQSLDGVVVLVGLNVLVGYLNLEIVATVVQSLPHLITLVGDDKIGYVSRLVIARRGRVRCRVAVAAPVAAARVGCLHRGHHAIGQVSFGLLEKP